jgi:hypothetical protein
VLLKPLRRQCSQVIGRIYIERKLVILDNVQW